MRIYKGFTLIEILVVIGIIGILATIAVYSLTIARSQARTAKVQADLKTISNALTILAQDTNEWPGHQEPYVICADLPGGCPEGNELEDLSVREAGLADTDDAFENWKGPYMAVIPKDPWGHNYFFDTDYDTGAQGMQVVVGSYGPNGAGLNQYDADDIILILQ